MAIVFVDGMAHYTTNAQLITKVAAESSAAPVAGAGANGEPGIIPGNHPHGYKINHVASSVVEISAHVKPASVDGSPGNAISWFDVPQDPGDGSIGCQCRLKIWSNGQIDFYRMNTLLGSTPANTIQMNVHSHLYVLVEFSNTVGTCLVRVNGATVLNLSGLDNSHLPVAQASDVRFFGAIGAGSSATWSHVIVATAANDITSQPRLGALFPDGAGNYSAWTPSAGVNWQNVDEATPDDDTTYNASSTVGNRDSYTMQNLPADATTVAALAVTARIKKDDASARTVEAFLRIGGVDYDHGTAKTVPGDYGFLQWIWRLSPATGVAFTVAEVNGLEAGIRVAA